MLRNAFDLLWINLLLAVLLTVLIGFFPVLGSAGANLAPTMAGAMGAGMLHARRDGADASSGYAWRAALAMTVVSLMFGMLVLFGLQKAGAGLLPPDMGAGMHLVIWSVAFMIAFLTIRLFFGLGVKNVLKGRK